MFETLKLRLASHREMSRRVASDRFASIVSLRYVSFRLISFDLILFSGGRGYIDIVKFLDDKMATSQEFTG